MRDDSKNGCVADYSEHELDEIVEGIMRDFPNSGYLRMTGLLRVRESMRRVNPGGVLLRAPSYELFAEDGIKSAVLLPCGILMVKPQIDKVKHSLTDKVV